MSIWPYVGVAVIAVVAALAAAADGALLVADRAASRQSGSSAAADRERARRTLSFARLLCQLGIGIGIGVLVRARGATAGHILMAMLAAVAIVLITETGARAWGDARHERVGRLVAPLLTVLDTVLAPFTALAAALDRFTARALPVPQADDEDREMAAAQFREVVAAEAEVTHGEAALLDGVFSLGDTEVHEVMVPRVDIVGVAADMPWSEVVDRVRSSEHSRFPVYDETLDDILGLLYAKDLLPSILNDAEPEGGWRSLTREATFVPRTKTIGDQLRDFRDTHQHIVLVADEFGGIAGLVTIEDVLEEIVGEIRDEYDEEEPEMVAEEGRRFWVAGRVTLEELSELLGRDFERDGITTVGGLVYDHLGRVPRPGESFVLGGFKLVVERIVRRKIERVYFERLGAERGEAPG